MHEKWTSEEPHVPPCTAPLVRKSWNFLAILTRSHEGLRRVTTRAITRYSNAHARLTRVAQQWLLAWLELQLSSTRWLGLLAQVGTKILLKNWVGSNDLDQSNGPSPILFISWILDRLRWKFNISDLNRVWIEFQTVSLRVNGYPKI